MPSEEHPVRVHRVVKAVSLPQILLCLLMVLIGRYLVRVGATTIGLLLAGMALGMLLTAWWFGYYD